MTSEAQGENVGYGWECHDCGEVYALGASTIECIKQGHYVAPIAACELPLLERYLNVTKTE